MTLLRAIRNFMKSSANGCLSLMLLFTITRGSLLIIEVYNILVYDVHTDTVLLCIVWIVP